MTAQNQRYAADTEHVERDDTPAVIVALETLAALADPIHRHRLAVAGRRQELAELADAPPALGMGGTTCRRRSAPRRPARRTGGRGG
jgi:hypothetical protein